MVFFIPDPVFVATMANLQSIQFDIVEAKLPEEG